VDVIEERKREKKRKSSIMLSHLIQRKTVRRCPIYYKKRGEIETCKYRNEREKE